MIARFYFESNQQLFKESQNIVFENALTFKAKASRSQSDDTYEMFVQFINLNTTGDNRFSKAIELSSEKFKIKRRNFLSNDDTDCWHFIGKNSWEIFDFDITLNITNKNINTLNVLHETEGWADFELMGEGGSVKVHRFALAVVSPVFRRMLSTGCWKENLEGRVTIDGSKKTLEHMKSYIYEQKLPDTDLKPLLLLACYYEIVNLEQDCVNKMVGNVSDDDIYDLLEFAISNKVHRLTYAILKYCKRYDLVLNKLKELINSTGGSSSVENTGD